MANNSIIFRNVMGFVSIYNQFADLSSINQKPWSYSLIWHIRLAKHFTNFVI